MLSQIDWDNPQYSYRFKLVYSLRTKIERLFSRMKLDRNLWSVGLETKMEVNSKKGK